MDISNVYERSCFPAAALLARILSQTSRKTYEGSTSEWYIKSKFLRCGRPTGRPLHIKELSFLGVSLVWNESSFYVPLPAPWLLCAFVFLCFCFTLWSRVCALLTVYDVAASPRRAPKSLALQLHLSPSTTPLQVKQQTNTLGMRHEVCVPGCLLAPTVGSRISERPPSTSLRVPHIQAGSLRRRAT